MTKRQGLAMLALAASCCLSACKGCGARNPSLPAERPSLSAVSTKPIAAITFLGGEIHLDESALAAKVKNVLDDAGLFAPPSPSRPVARVGLQAELVTASASAESEIGAKVRLRITVQPSGAQARFAEDVEAMGQVPLAKGSLDEARVAFQRLVERTAEDLTHAYVTRQKLWEGDSSAIAASLHSEDSELRIEALRIVAARKLREVVPTLLQMLSDDEENVRDAALGALVALRERSAVKALAESRQMRDAREMRKILDAIAILGGREAKDYLSFVAETHDDEEIRRMAKQALERLSRRDEPKPSTK